METCGHPKEVWNRSETVRNCRKAAISADPTFVWKFVDIPKRSETGLKPSETVGKQLYPLDPTFVWKFVDVPKRSETGLKPSETVGKQLYPLYICMEICGHPKEVWNRSETVWNRRKAAISTDPTFVWKFVDVPKRSETGLKPSETVGKQLYPLILHLYGNLWTSQRGLKQVWNRLKL